MNRLLKRRRRDTCFEISDTESKPTKLPSQSSENFCDCLSKRHKGLQARCSELAKSLDHTIQYYSSSINQHDESASKELLDDINHRVRKECQTLWYEVYQMRMYLQICRYDSTNAVSWKATAEGINRMSSFVSRMFDEIHRNSIQTADLQPGMIKDNPSIDFTLNGAENALIILGDIAVCYAILVNNNFD